MIIAPVVLTALAVLTLAAALLVGQPMLAAGALIAASVFSVGAALCLALDRLRRAVGASLPAERRTDAIRKELA